MFSRVDTMNRDSLGSIVIGGANTTTASAVLVP